MRNSDSQDASRWSAQRSGPVGSKKNVTSNSPMSGAPTIAPTQHLPTNLKKISSGNRTGSVNPGTPGVSVSEVVNINDIINEYLISPQIDGFETYKQLIARHPDQKAIKSPEHVSLSHYSPLTKSDTQTQKSSTKRISILLDYQLSTYRAISQKRF